MLLRRPDCIFTSANRLSRRSSHRMTPRPNGYGRNRPAWLIFPRALEWPPVPYQLRKVFLATPVPGSVGNAGVFERCARQAVWKVDLWVWVARKRLPQRARLLREWLVIFRPLVVPALERRC